MLPKLAQNPANKIIVVPADMAGLAGLATSLAQMTQSSQPAPQRAPLADAALAAVRSTTGAQPQLTAAGVPQPNGTL